MRFASSVARKFAKEHGITDFSLDRATGCDLRVRKQDLLDYLEVRIVGTLVLYQQEDKFFEEQYLEDACICLTLTPLKRKLSEINLSLEQICNKLQRLT